jgi:DNA-binding transcriptional MocR family regulator
VLNQSNGTVENRETLGAARLALLLQGWREGGSGSLARRLAYGLRSRISSGLLEGGTILPPERSVASALGVSRATIVAALEELRSSGYVTSRQGSGTWIPDDHRQSGPPGTTAERLLPAAHILNLASSVPRDASQLPDIKIDIAELASVAPSHGYEPAGLPLLREVIARRHQVLGLATQPQQVHVTNGAQHALDLALGAVTKSGDIVAVEDPTYVGVSDLLQRRRLRALPLPLELVDDATHDLTNLVKARRAKALLLVPAVHSPTGKVRHAQQLHALAEQLDLIGLPIIEDNTVADLVFTGKRPPSLASLCHKVPVITVESTSKVGWGGLRVGWVRGPQAVIEATITERSRTDYGTSVPSQLLVIKLLADYDSVVRQRRKALKSAAVRFADLMSKHLPDWKWQAPGGGLSAWIDTGTDSEILATHALRHRVAVATGVSASRSPSARTYIRVCFDRPHVELEVAVVRLARAADDTRGYRA